jgi:hypothetical protein
MGQHGRRIALLTSELLMGDGGEEHDGVTFLGNSVLVRRSIKSSTSLGTCPVRSSSLRSWLSSGVFFARVNQSAISEVLI